MSWMFYSEIPPKNETAKQKIKRLKKENKSYREYIALAKKSKVIEIGLTYAVLKSIEFNEKKIKELENGNN